MNTVTFRPIGVIRTSHKKKSETSFQPLTSKGIKGIIEIFPEFREGLADLEGFDRIWLLFCFHLSEGFKLKVIPPRESNERGLFATRSPHRPNPIGLTTVRLEKVDMKKGEIAVADVDMLDGTPILDIKPYIPSGDCYPDANTGWIGHSNWNRQHRNSLTISFYYKDDKNLTI